MKQLLFAIISLSMLLSGCASFLNGTYQQVDIKTDSGFQVKVDGSEPDMKDGKVLLKRDGRFKLITFQKDGYKDANIAVGQTKLSPLYVLSWIPFGVTLFAPIFDPVSSRSFNYPGNFDYEAEMVAMPVKESKGLDIMLNKVGLDLKAEKIQFRYFPNFKYFMLNAGAVQNSLAGEREDYKIENTAFSNILNELLKENGFVDTTRKVFKRSYLNNILLNATITRYRITQVNSRWGGAMLFVDLTIDWEILDYYEQTIGAITTEVGSGQFPFNRYYSDGMRNTLEIAIEDAMEYGLIDLINGEDMQLIINGRGQDDIEKAFEPITLAPEGNFATGVAEAVKSTVTVKTTDGHGSGFIIGSEGYIVTNHHVVLDTVAPTVVLNDGAEYKAKIVRESLIHDLALLKIDATGLRPLKVSNSHDFQIASDVYVIGTPTAEDLPQTVSRGIISGIRTPRENSRLIQTDASINGGNSGGPIINERGEVIGVVSTKVWGFGIEGVAFGIPAYEIADRLRVNVP